MTADLAVGAIGLAGALVGGGVTLGVAYLNNRAQRAEAERTRSNQRAAAELTRSNQLADARSAACIGFLTRVDSFLNQARELNDLLDLPAGDDRLVDVHRQYTAEWNQLVASNATVQVAGPDSLAQHAQQLVGAVGELADLIDKRYRNKRWPAGGEAAREEVWKVRLDFIHAARQAYGVTTSESAATVGRSI
ncbi:hypothetical protein [Micromonospora sp. SL4-19]|uniref:hypothetical protein n=1 Tax=Micromonospora sp. SL4-19 TaxID=3399129 RepID=UPI003A4E1887